MFKNLASKKDISIETYQELFFLSGNRCAHPECAAVLVEPSSESCPVRVIGRACPVYAVAEEGPRGKPGLTSEEFNSPRNLVLLCPRHHETAARRHQRHPAAELALWKREREAAARGRSFSESAEVSEDCFLEALVAREIENGVAALGKFRFFEEFEAADRASRFAARLKRGDLSGGPDPARSRALAWCLRILALAGNPGEAEKCLDAVKSLGNPAETMLADAFVSLGGDGAESAVGTLSGVGSPEARSAVLEIISRDRGPARAVDWMKTAGIDATDLDPDGRYFLLECQLELGRWAQSRVLLDALGDECPLENPALGYLIAITRTLSAVPDELRPVLRRRPPFYSGEFHLSSEAAALGDREKARELFGLAEGAVREAGCFAAAKECEQYRFWLELSGPDRSETAAERFRERFRSPGTAFHLVRLGLHFGIGLDSGAVEEEILRYAALHGRVSPSTARARLALVVAGENAPRSPALLRERATECLGTLGGEELSAAEREDLESLVAYTRQDDRVVESLEKRFDEAGFLSAHELADELEARGEWDVLCEYCEILFERTRSLRSAERLAVALVRAKSTARLVRFVRENGELAEMSVRIRALYLRALYSEGALLELRRELEENSDSGGDARLRADLAVSLCDWDALYAAARGRYLEKASGCARDLVDLAGFAARLDLEGAGELAASTARTILAVRAVADRAGWEDGEELGRGLEKAVLLSGGGRPRLGTVPGRPAGRDYRESDVRRRLCRAEIPLAPAARFLGESLFDLIFFPALENLSRNDARTKRTIPVRGAECAPPRFDAAGIAGFDCAALVTLGFLDLLDEALDAFASVRVTHLTPAWLFEEKRNASFRRRELVRDAREVDRLLAAGTLEKLECCGAPDGDLSSRVGPELAALIAEAEKRDDGAAGLVVRSTPLYRVGSLMDEEADIGERSGVLVGCRRVVEKLREKGCLTAEAEEKALVYPEFHESPGPEEPEVADGARLYLDASTVICFLRAGILGELKSAGFRVFIPPATVSETEALLRYERSSAEISGGIERVRSALCSRIGSGKVKVAAELREGAEKRSTLYGNTVAGLRALARECDLIVTDDGFFSRRAGAELPVQVLSTPDVLDALVSRGSITSRRRLECRDRLREAGYFVFPEEGNNHGKSRNPN